MHLELVAWSDGGPASVDLVAQLPPPPASTSPSIAHSFPLMSPRRSPPRSKTAGRRVRSFRDQGGRALAFIFGKRSRHRGSAEGLLAFFKLTFADGTQTEVRVVVSCAGPFHATTHHRDRDRVNHFSRIFVISFDNSRQDLRTPRFPTREQLGATE